MTEPITIDELTFGVELEVIMPRDNRNQDGRTALAAAMTAAGAPAQHEAYNHANRPHWKVTTDASIGYDNAEVVSPILRGAAGFEALRLAVTAIDGFGCRVSRATGLHVHVGVRDRFSERVGFFKELVRTYAKFELVLDSIVAPSRREGNNTYCGQVRWHDRLEAATSVDEVRRAYGGNRFVKLNLEAFSAHGTVEFRQHQGTTNAQKVENWVKLCLRLVAHAAKNTEASRASFVPQHVTRHREPSGPVDLDRAVRLPAENANRSAIYRHSRRHWVFTAVASYNPRRSGTRGHDNWRHYAVGRTLEEYLRAGGTFDHLRWDIAHRNVTVVDRRTAPAVSAEGDVHPLDSMLAPAPTPVTVERPATDAAPATLDGLLDLIDAAPAERSFFTERQMELNG